MNRITKLISVATVAGITIIGLTQGPTSARTIFDEIQDSAPRTVFDDIRDTAPRTVFDDIQDTAPRTVFDDIQDSAPRSGGSSAVSRPGGRW